MRTTTFLWRMRGGMVAGGGARGGQQRECNGGEGGGRKSGGLGLAKLERRCLSIGEELKAQRQTKDYTDAGHG